MSKLHDVFMKTAFEFSAKSKCVSHHVGAVVVKDDRIIISGYNGTPKGLPNCCDVFDKDNFDRGEHHKWSKDNEIHAEMNAIGFAAKHNVELNGCDMYVTISPCNDCLKNLCATGIKNVYYLYLYDKSILNPELLKVVNVQEVPGADKIKKWVNKNDLLYISKQSLEFQIEDWYLKGFRHTINGVDRVNSQYEILNKAYGLGKICANGDEEILSADSILRLI